MLGSTCQSRLWVEGLDQVLFADSEGGMAQPAQSQLLQLADALPGQVELVADLLQGAGHTVEEPVAKSEDALLAVGQARDGSRKR